MIIIRIIIININIINIIRYDAMKSYIKFQKGYSFKRQNSPKIIIIITLIIIYTAEIKYDRKRKAGVNL